MSELTGQQHSMRADRPNQPLKKSNRNGRDAAGLLAARSSRRVFNALLVAYLAPLAAFSIRRATASGFDT